jgi:hypothetical protein
MSNDTVMRPKDPSEYGKTKYLVELFVTERFVATIYANDEQAVVTKGR